MTINSNVEGSVATVTFGDEDIAFDLLVRWEVPPPVDPFTYYYVNSAAGNDSNDGLTPATAWATLAKLQGFIDVNPVSGNTKFLFKGNQDHVGVLSLGAGDVVNANTTDAPVIFGKYGAGYPTFRATGGSLTARAGGFVLDRCRGVIIEDIIFRTSAASAEKVSCGIWIRNTSATEFGDIIVRRCDTMGFYTTAQSNGSTAGAHVYITVEASGAGLRGIRIEDCRMHGAAVTSKDCAGVQGFSWGKNIFDLVCRGNHVWNMGTQDVTNNHASGILANGVNGALIEYNLAHDIGATWSKCGGPVGIWGHDANAIHLRYNEVYRVKPTAFTAGCDWNGLGFDGAAGVTTNSICEFNYSHDNGGSGLYHWASPAQNGNVLRFNRTERNNTNQRTTHGEISFNGNSNSQGGIVHVYNNECYAEQNSSGQGSCLCFQGLAAGMPAVGSTISGNLFSAEIGAFSRAVVAEGNQNTIANLDNAVLSNNVWNVRSGNFRVQNWGGTTGYDSYAAWAAVTGEIGGVATVGGTIPPPPEFGMYLFDFDTQPYISMIAGPITAGAAQGTPIGNLSVVNAPGSWTFAIKNSAMGRVQLSGNVLQAGETVTDLSVDPGVILVAVVATQAGQPPLERYFKLLVV